MPLKDREKQLQYQREHYLRNKQLYIDRGKAWKRANPEKTAEGRKRYAEAHRDEIREKKRIWAKLHRKEHYEKNVRWRRENPEKHHAQIMRSYARKRERVMAGRRLIEAKKREAIDALKVEGINPQAVDLYAKSPVVLRRGRIDQPDLTTRTCRESTSSGHSTRALLHARKDKDV